MPLYDFKCPCGKVQTCFRRYEDRDEGEACGCGCVANRIPTVPMIARDYEGYTSPATGKWVEGKKQHLEDLKRSGCRLFEPGEREHFLKKGLAEHRKESEKLVDQAVEAAARDIGLG